MAELTEERVREIVREELGVAPARTEAPLLRVLRDVAEANKLVEELQAAPARIEPPALQVLRDVVEASHLLQALRNQGRREALFKELQENYRDVMGAMQDIGKKAA